VAAFGTKFLPRPTNFSGDPHTEYVEIGLAHVEPSCGEGLALLPGTFRKVDADLFEFRCEATRVGVSYVGVNFTTDASGATDASGVAGQIALVPFTVVPRRIET